MKAARILEFGDPAKLQIVEADRPKPGAGQVLIAVHAAGINPSDISNLAGKFSQTKLPRIPGRDYSGVVVEGPEELCGMEAWGTGGELGFTQDGTHAEFVVVPAASVRPKPRNLSMEQAAVGVPLVTASMAVDAARLRSGETFVVTGSQGSVGSAAVQIAKWQGAKVIGVQLGKEKGFADDVIDSQQEDVAKRITELTSGRGADACLDTVGGPLFDAALAGLGHRGRFVAIPAAKDERVSFNLRDFYHRLLTLIGVDSLGLDAVGAGQILAKLTEGFESSHLQPPEVRTVPLERAVDAYAEMASGKTSGKLVLVTNAN